MLHQMEERDFICSTCNNIFSNFIALLRHLRHHFNITFNCGINYCTRENLDYLALRRHLRVHHLFLFEVDTDFSLIHISNSFFP